MLELLGYTVSLAENGRKAIDAATTQTFDLILMDCQMPEMDGYEATTVIREREGTHNTPIIAMTAAAMASDRERCLAVGMDDYVAKPVDADLLASVLDRWIGAAGLSLPAPQPA